MGRLTQSCCKGEFLSPLRCLEKVLFELCAFLRREGVFYILVNQFALYNVEFISIVAIGQQAQFYLPRIRFSEPTE